MVSPKINPRGDSFISFDYLAALENGIFKISLFIDEIPDDLKITYRFAIDNPWRVIEKLENTNKLNASFAITAFGFYHITVTLFSKGKTFTFDTPNYDHTPNNAINYLADNADFTDWRAKLNSLYSSKYTELKQDADFASPLELFRIANPNIHIIVHNDPTFPHANRTEHEQKIWDNVDNYGNPFAIRDALYETPPRLITHAWDEFHYENIADIADCISGKGEANFYIDERGVFTVSDSTSHFVNTISGHRITYGQPESSERTIWHVGFCRVFSNGAPDWGTIDSFLQGAINEKFSDKKIRVENFGYNRMVSHPDQPMKIVRSLEPYMQDGDIVILDSLIGFPNVTGVLHCDISQLLQRPHNYGECFFDRTHLTENGNRAIAEKLFDFIKKNNLLENSLEREIGINVAGGGTRNRLLSREKHTQFQAYLSKIAPLRPWVGAIVMNCNPFTLGHRYLIEQSAAKCEKLFIFVVEEDKSIFPFADRIELVRQGTVDIKNVVVVPSGNFIISSLTFTDYFGKSEMQDRTIDPSLDVELFAQYIAPQMGINIRFAGEEPLDNVTRQYNEAMARILPRHGVAFKVIPRKETGGGVISASRVRKLLEKKDFKAIKKLVPKTTLKYLRKGAKVNEFSLSCLCKLSVGKNAWQSLEDSMAEDSAADALNNDSQPTKTEDNPCWEIDLKNVYKLSHIKLTNGRQACQEKTGILTVKVSESGQDGDWQTLHTGIMHWDGDVTFFLAGRVKARWVRLSLKDHSAFHPADVEIWGCAPSIKQLTPPAPERFCLYDAPSLAGMDEISKGAAVTKGGNALTFDFKDVYPIEFLVFEKPPAVGWDGAESLRLEISRDAHSWQLIHEGLMFWAAKMYYPLCGEVIGRYVRLSPGPAPAEKKGLIRSLFASSAKALGLEKVRVFTKKVDLTRNLAPAGQARQSSEYAWGGGRTDAANALNDDGQRDLGFHTKEEDNPWWEVELEEVCALDRIVLVNRRRVCQERIQTLTVEVSPEKPGEEWVTIHTGLISWDGSLVLPLGGRIKARRVRLSLREKRMFHLASVEVWGAPLSVRPEGSIEPERFYLYDQEAENGCEVLLKGSLELGPGLVVAELTAAAPLEALLISKAGEENWPDLKIESSRDGQKWLTIHEGQLYWAGQMHYPLQGEVFARFVRLSSKTEAEKGEKAAPINVKILNTKEKQGLCVIHRKHAGLGDRMCSFVNAMYLADVLALPMRMVWPVMDRPNFECEGTDVLDPGVDGAENVFDENFRSAHLRPDLPLTYASKLLAKQNLNRRNLIAPTMMDEPGLLHSSKLNIKTLLSRGLAPSETWELRHYFKQIGFAPELRAVIEAAEKIDLEAGMTAIHFRAGDLVYRSDRSITFEDILFGFQTKGLPLQLARMSIEHALKSGYKNIIIFSENVTVSQTLADDYNIRYARQFWPAGKLSTPQISFFEAVLMSRASVIYRPDSSAFSNFAQTISEGAKMVNAHEFFTYEDILPYFQADLKKNGTRYPAPQNANSYGYLYYISKSRQKTDFLLEILEAAALAAPGNVTFKVFKALELFQAGRDGEGEAALKEVFAFNHKAKNFDLIDTSSRALRDKNFVNWRNAELKPVFESAAQRGNPFACYMTSLIYSCQGKQAEATSWHEAALRNIA